MSNKQPADALIHNQLNALLGKLENEFNSDVISFSGPIEYGLEKEFLSIVEDLKADAIGTKSRLTVVLTTEGGSAETVERFVNIIRHHYSEVDFIVPDYAYSAGTIFCMSGDNIYMDYYSTLGPIDPQVRNKDGRWVAALGYLDKIKELLEKANNSDFSAVEFSILKDFDLGELRSYEQAKDLTIDLLKKWLVRYKFKNCEYRSSTKAKVTLKEKEDKAADIARQLSDNNKWKSHGRSINVEELTKLGLKIEDYSSDANKTTIIREYYDLLSDYRAKRNIQIFVHSRRYI